MASLSQIRRAIADHLTAETGTTVLPTIPASPIPPLGYLRPESMEREGHGFVVYELTLVVVAAAADTINGQDTLDDMLSTATVASVTAPLDSVTAAAPDTSTTITWDGWTNYGIREFSNGTRYFAADVTLMARTLRQDT